MWREDKTNGATIDTIDVELFIFTLDSLYYWKCLPMDISCPRTSLWWYQTSSVRVLRFGWTWSNVCSKQIVVEWSAKRLVSVFKSITHLCLNDAIAFCKFFLNASAVRSIIAFVFGDVRAILVLKHEKREETKLMTSEHRPHDVGCLFWLGINHGCHGCACVRDLLPVFFFDSFCVKYWTVD